MAKITISFENTSGDIPTYELTKDEVLLTNLIDEQLDLRDGEVIVCFQSWKDQPYENEHPDIFITKEAGNAIEYMEDFIKNMPTEEIDFNFFCFHSFEEAFKYCTDLKEGL